MSDSPTLRLNSVLSPSRGRLSVLLQPYFLSGWAFLIPYLAVYLIYAWLRWPVNVADAGIWIPCLLHAFWILHGIHLLLGAITLRAWWRTRYSASKENSGFRSLISSLWPLLPWLCLALIFWIPGVYLEFPADPWEHYARINQWWDQLDVTAHPSWIRLSYFLAYSFIGWIVPPLLQLKWIEVYYTACCLLLCWQYYRLARSAGLGEHASLIFVLIQALTLGNNIFGFYRYYGMSSSLFAQLGAVALTRIAIEVAKSQQLSVRKFFNRSSMGSSASPIVSTPTVYRLLLAGSLLLALTALNHIQGLGIAGLGIATVVCWRLIEWRRSMFGWLALAAVILSFAIIYWFPRHTALDDIYRQQAWLTPLYGFNLFSPSSPAFTRSIEILGFAGFTNLTCALILFRWNNIVSWLSIGSILALTLPVIAIPLATSLATHYKDGAAIITYHRMLLTIPPGLAVVVIYVVISKSLLTPRKMLLEYSPAIARTLPMLAIQFALVAAVTLPATSPYFNRLWHCLATQPADLTMSRIVDSAAAGESRGHFSRLLASAGIGHIWNVYGSNRVFYLPARTLQDGPAVSERMRLTRRFISVAPNDSISSILVLPKHLVLLHSQFSFAGILSGHWLPNEVALNFAGTAEFKSAANSAGYTSKETPAVRYYMFQPK